MACVGVNGPALRRAGQHRVRVAGLLLLTLAATNAASAQNISNEAWLGQVGGLNTLSILQEGLGNSAGADNISLLLGQDGSENSLDLTQSGYNNKLGTLFADVPGYTRGVAQTGTRNTITIEQRNTDANGSNMIGAVQQLNARGLPAASNAINELTITQTAEGGANGVGGHFIGRILQNTSDDADAANSATLTQSGGGTGEGNIFANLSQIGSGNSFTGSQTGTLNRIGELPPSDGLSPTGGVFQNGSANVIAFAQTGDRNTIEYVEQYGRTNKLTFAVDGNRNVAALIYQNNESWGEAAVGNRISAAVSGSDNGGGGSGWVGELIATPTLAVPGVAQGVLSQIGDANGIDLTIIQGLDSRYGISQVGTGNQAQVSFAAEIPGTNAVANESALFQVGDDNYLAHTVSGHHSVAAIRVEGNRNNLRLTQTGGFNLTHAVLIGNDNNAPGFVLSGDAGLLAASLGDGLGAGDIRQAGTGSAESDQNSITIGLTGSGNGFAFFQNGEQNTANSTISGSFNSLAVAQSQVGNVAEIAQTGQSNTMAMHQF